MWLTSSPCKNSTFSKPQAEAGEAMAQNRQSATEEEESFLPILATAPQSSVISCKSVAKMWRKLIGYVMKTWKDTFKIITIVIVFLGIITKYHSQINNLEAITA
jgi:hypothetical protein